jgi:hypothetical protein
MNLGRLQVAELDPHNLSPPTDVGHPYGCGMTVIMGACREGEDARGGSLSLTLVRHQAGVKAFVAQDLQGYPPPIEHW